MRGKLQRLLPHLQLYRITPADAGKTTLDIIGRMLYKDHPRRCGENLHIPAATVKEKGSPPQVRGKRAQTPPGKSSWDHPRRCGENADCNGFTFRRNGSPPQVRGKLSRIHPLLHFHRITPAGAGKTGRRQRTRGYYRGSPPQVRGKLFLCFPSFADTGITPAGAGKTTR